ncbi:MAG TPA: hypothetical protein VFH51_05800, partial [Myxococcota bacterium]|nr:hypothetical protein [Myxococcota bacterium]
MARVNALAQEPRARLRAAFDHAAAGDCIASAKALLDVQAALPAPDALDLSPIRRQACSAA